MIVAIAEIGEIDLVAELFPLGFTGKIIVTGVGMANTIRSLANIPKNETILNIGYVGSNYYKRNEWVQINEVQTAHQVADFDDGEFLTAHNPLKKEMQKAKCYTSSDFVSEWHNSEPAVFDMELAGIVALGFDEVVSLKKVSDNLSLDEYRNEVAR